MAVRNDGGSLIADVAGPLSLIPEQPTFDPVANLERESRCFRDSRIAGARIWRNSDCVVLGRFLDAEKEVYLDRAAALAVPVLRRVSGGGAVYHDLGNVNYSMFLNEGCLNGASWEEALRLLSFPVTTLLDGFDVTWSWDRTNAVLVEGRKISGSAQARKRGVLLHHGTFLVNSDLRRMNALLKQGGRSSNMPTINLKELIPLITADEVEEKLKSAFGTSRS